jgi:uncharacterized protein YaiI (UPF0178 family)
MKIWVDADACPGAVRDIIIKTAVRLSIDAVFVANKTILLPQSPYLTTVTVEALPDAADHYIRDTAEKSDVVITHDIPLASQLVPKEILVLDPRGHKYTHENIGERLSIRNFMEDMRSSGEIQGGPKQFGEKEKRQFAALLDRELTRLLKSRRTDSSV